LAPEPDIVPDGDGEDDIELLGGASGGGSGADGGVLLDPIAPVPLEGEENVCGGAGTGYALVALVAAEGDASPPMECTEASLRLGETELSLRLSEAEGSF
jgi:hypothetical protein